MRMLIAAAATMVLVTGARAEDKKYLDNDFLVHAHVGCNAIIQIADTVDDRTKNDQVKELAEQIKKDHKKGEEALAKEIKDRKIASVAGTEKELKETIDRLKKLEGNELDREFLKIVVDSHEKAIKACKTQGESGKEKACSEVAKEMIPTLQKHLDRAKEIQKTIK